MDCQDLIQIYGAQRMISDVSVDPPKIYLAPSSGQICIFLNLHWLLTKWQQDPLRDMAWPVQVQHRPQYGVWTRSWRGARSPP